MSLSITVLFIPSYSYVKDSFLPIGTLLAEGKAAEPLETSARRLTGRMHLSLPTASLVARSRPVVSEAIGLTREDLEAWFVILGTIQWCCLDLGRSRQLRQSNQTEPKSGRSWHRSALSIAALKSTGIERRLPPTYCIISHLSPSVGVRQWYSNLFMGSPRLAKQTTPK